jgi:ribosomal-protein-alanine N-acetyltransferase
MVRLKKAYFRYIELLMELERKCFIRDQFSYEQFVHAIKRSKSSDLFLIKAHKQYVGYVYIRKFKTSVKLYSICILPEYRQRGYAKEVMRFLEILYNLRFKSILLEVAIDNVNAIILYQKCGFTQIKKIPHYYEDGTAAIRMKKDLKCQTTKER